MLPIEYIGRKVVSFKKVAYQFPWEHGKFVFSNAAQANFIYIDK